jgi:rod shape-determining protein MreC
MTIDHRFNDLNAARSALSLFAYPLQYLVDVPSRIEMWTRHTLAAREALVEENRRLREQHLILRARLQKLSALEHENTRLHELLKSSSRLKRDRVLVAELLAVDLDPFRQRVVINKGTNHGVYVGQPLLDARGVMGQVTGVNPLSANAILISDPSHALPVQINRNGLRMLAFGTGNAELLSLRHLPVNADVKMHDVVSTSGLGGRYPPDYPVARITRVERRLGEPFATVEARPFARLDQSREALLVWWDWQKEEDESQANATPEPASQNELPSPLP